ncbi:ribonuclease H-like domain-containing protein [Halorhabdus amylolytica]|uniref:ribonuclease H-like domain-containing protein n=1 Tax=Halorhabdus amylolytica TaxID=2559573 RepID=UPI0020C06D7B|nr:ribonuclease H-like domain-containing protein [Halorhabdus amylolytica]
MSERLTHVPLDIETSGFETTAKVTVIGFTLPLGSRIFLNTDGRDVDTDTLEIRLSRTFGEEIQLSAHQTETALLEEVAAFADEKLAPRDYLLVAYNGERFNGGFDLPFLRTRYTLQNCRWPFDGLPYADLLPVIQDRFNTRIDGEEQTGS